MKFKNFYEIKAIDEARAIKIFEWYEKHRGYEVSIIGGPGIILGSQGLIELLSIFGNSKNLERDFNQWADKLFSDDEEDRK